MKLICIDTKHYTNITLGKLYDIFDDREAVDVNGKIHYWIKDDRGNVRGLPKDCFITLEEWRNNKIESIL